MTEPLGSSAQSQMKAIDAALKNFIQSGNKDVKGLSGIQQQIAALAKNPKIPDQVRQNLQLALNELKQMEKGERISQVSIQLKCRWTMHYMLARLNSQKPKQRKKRKGVL